jgi:hypothetical protein
MPKVVTWYRGQENGLTESRSKASATAVKPAAPSSGTMTATSVGSSQDRAD